MWCWLPIYVHFQIPKQESFTKNRNSESLSKRSLKMVSHTLNFINTLWKNKCQKEKRPTTSPEKRSWPRCNILFVFCQFCFVCLDSAVVHCMSNNDQILVNKITLSCTIVFKTLQIFRHRRQNTITEN